MSGPVRMFGCATSPDGTRHAAYIHDRSLKHGFGVAVCNYLLNLAWCEPLKPEHRVCRHFACQHAADEARAAFKDNPDNRGQG